MNLKSLLKAIKLNESSVSMVLGALVIVVVGVLVVNYFKKTDTGSTFPEGVQTEKENITLPTTHKVATNESLWSISEKYFGNGYNWVDIAEANNLSRADIISEGQELTIPNVPVRSLASADQQASPSATTEPQPTQSPSPEPSATPEQTIAPTVTPEAETPVPTEEKTIAENDSAIQGNTYTVERGDTLWDIAVRAYGDGYRWGEIAEANNLVNPNVIHSGNVFVLPR